MKGETLVSACTISSDVLFAIGASACLGEAKLLLVTFIDWETSKFSNYMVLWISTSINCDGRDI